MYLRKLPNIKLFALLILAAFVIGCRVMLIGAYDQVTDQSIQKIQVDITTVFVQLESNVDNNIPAQNEYKNFILNYTNIDAEIESLKIRCQSLPKYGIVLHQVQLLDSNVQIFKQLHKGGISKPIVETSKTLFETSFLAMITLQNGLKKESTK